MGYPIALGLVGGLAGVSVGVFVVFYNWMYSFGHPAPRPHHYFTMVEAGAIVIGSLIGGIVLGGVLGYLLKNWQRPR